MLLGYRRYKGFCPASARIDEVFHVSAPSTGKNAGSGHVRAVDPITGDLVTGDRLPDRAQTPLLAAPENPARVLPVPLVNSPPVREAPDIRPRAPFIAHLIATRMGLAHTRELRRAGTAIAGNAYREAGALTAYSLPRTGRRA